ncbi:hypothetical protein O181_111416 [Austropuccinia psidii MF-1]|uniref:Uncharacterized protein n=1 Tax=Austropuccinia psidii MF-1 TaxID=1389203 RepID=A0A9Q3PSN0_9BASI|nr:hypothetical protein [Austropuccinia psidii MF-1]
MDTTASHKPRLGLLVDDILEEGKVEINGVQQEKGSLSKEAEDSKDGWQSDEQEHAAKRRGSEESNSNFKDLDKPESPEDKARTLKQVWKRDAKYADESAATQDTIIPTNAVNQSSWDTPTTSSSTSASSSLAVGSISQKYWRTWWQLEAVIYHKPDGIMGTRILKSHNVYLLRYAQAQSNLHSSSNYSALCSVNHDFIYSITAPTTICCGDDVKLNIGLGNDKPQESGIILKRLKVSLARTLSIQLSPFKSSLEDASTQSKRWKFRRYKAFDSTNNSKSTSRNTSHFPTQCSVFTTSIAQIELVSRAVVIPPADSFNTTLRLCVPVSACDSKPEHKHDSQNTINQWYSQNTTKTWS